jgi:uncharacterized protein YgbK (DUF1537 family)
MLTFSELIARLPEQESEVARQQIVELLKRSGIRIAVLDDDPTGIQTVHDCLLLTNDRPANVATAMAAAEPFFYLLTNTRSMTAADAEHTVRRGMDAILDANGPAGHPLIFISRSDSTLRGHFPLEPTVMRAVLDERGVRVNLPVFFVPSFFEAGRHTVDDVHYMRDGEAMIPVADTEFARDNVFGYRHSNLKGYILEKSAYSIQEACIGHLPLELLRGESPAAITTRIETLRDCAYVTVDAMDYGDLRKFSIALLSLLEKSRGSVVLRTSSSLPKALSGIEDLPLLDRAICARRSGPGLFIVGSHVRKTTQQLQALLAAPGVEGVEIDILSVLGAPEKLLPEVLEKLKNLYDRGTVGAIYTSREELRLDDPAARLGMGQKISAFLVKIVQSLPFQPAYLVSKGGITSHDILTTGLGIERARVLGQILPGVPALLTGDDNRYPQMPFIIFPGNVGTEEALREVFEKLR